MFITLVKALVIYLRTWFCDVLFQKTTCTTCDRIKFCDGMFCRSENDLVTPPEVLNLQLLSYPRSRVMIPCPRPGFSHSSRAKRTRSAAEAANSWRIKIVLWEASPKKSQTEKDRKGNDKSITRAGVDSSTGESFDFWQIPNSLDSMCTDYQHGPPQINAECCAGSGTIGGGLRLWVAFFSMGLLHGWLLLGLTLFSCISLSLSIKGMAHYIVPWCSLVKWHPTSLQGHRTLTVMSSNTSISPRTRLLGAPQQRCKWQFVV